MTQAAAIGVVNHGVGNLGSVMNMLRYINAVPVLVSTPEEVAAQHHLILPGVGSYDAGIAGLRESGMADAVLDHAAAGKPLLGICLGMQMLLEGSSEGELPGLGLIPGRCDAFADHVTNRRIPHMGWRDVHPVENGGFALPDPGRFYFAHSYFAPLAEGGITWARATYGVGFSAVVGRDSVVGMQFHPEKSHRFGMAVLTEFAGWRA